MSLWCVPTFVLLPWFCSYGLRVSGKAPPETDRLGEFRLPQSFGAARGARTPRRVDCEESTDDLRRMGLVGACPCVTLERATSPLYRTLLALLRNAPSLWGDDPV